jgi:hypothetical protein
MKTARKLSEGSFMPVGGLRERFQQERPITADVEPTPISGTKPTNFCASRVLSLKAT